MAEPPAAPTADTDADTLALLERLVALDSQNPGPGEAAVGTFVADVARERGFAVRTVEGSPGRPNVIVDVDAGGTGGPCLGFNAHLDTKPVGDARPLWRTDPLRLTLADGRAYGLGTSDMKGAVAALLSAATRWSASAARGRVQLVFSADEEAGSALGAALLAREGALDADAMLVAEPCGMAHSWEALYLVARGMTCFDVAVHTTQGHSGLSERLGPSATVAAARMIDALARFAPSHPASEGVATAPTVNAGVRVEGGVFYGVHPGEARFASEVRLVPGMRRETFDRELRAVLDAALPDGARYELTYPDGPLGWVDAAGIAPAHPLVGCVQRAAEQVLGAPLPLAAYPGGTDACFFALDAGIPSVAAFGPGLLSVAHGANEYVPLADLGAATAMYEHVMRAYPDAAAGARDGGDR